MMTRLYLRQHLLLTRIKFVRLLTHLFCLMNELKTDMLSPKHLLLGYVRCSDMSIIQIYPLFRSCLCTSYLKNN